MNRKYLTVLAGISLLIIVVGCGEPNKPPTVSITEPQEGVTHGGEIQFGSIASDQDGSISEYSWDFGDGASSSDAAPSHSYTQSGQYRVELTVTDDKGENATDGITIDVQIGPEAIAEIGRAEADNNIRMQFISDESPLMINFSGSRSRAEPGTELVSFHWDFGNGDELDQADPTYTYLDPGDYTATLTVTDNKGNTSSSEVRINVISYEAIRESIELAGGSVEYELYTRDSTQESNTSSLFLKYIAHANRILTEEEIGLLFDEIIRQARSRPRITRITVQLYTEDKAGFMNPREYAHYVGLAIWDSRTPLQEGEEEIKPSINLNQSYLDGSAPSVLAARIIEELLQPGDPRCGPICHEHRLGWTDIYILEADVCKQELDLTLREIAQWRLAANFAGFIGTVWSQDLEELASIAGKRANGVEINELPFQIFAKPPLNWDLQEDQLWISHTGVPNCDSSP